jgi:hypothetical protein
LILGGRYSPRFETLTEGFTSLKMITRIIGEHHGTPPPPSKTPTHPYSWDASAFLGSESDDLETGKNAYKNNCWSYLEVVYFFILKYL